MVLLESSDFQYGTLIQDFDLPDTVTGKNFSSQNLKNEIVVIAFICNHCPYVVRIIDQFSKLAKKTLSFVDFVAISSNDPDYREEDSPENMNKFAQDHDFSFPYLFDETQKIAKSFGAVCTPDIFVYKKIDKQFKLAYHARFEDLEKALYDLKDSDRVAFEQLPSAGCSIKWK